MSIRVLWEEDTREMCEKVIRETPVEDEGEKESAQVGEPQTTIQVWFHIERWAQDENMVKELQIAVQLRRDHGHFCRGRRANTGH